MESAGKVFFIDFVEISLDFDDLKYFKLYLEKVRQILMRKFCY